MELVFSGIFLFTFRDMEYFGKLILGIFAYLLKGICKIACLLPGVWDIGDPTIQASIQPWSSYSQNILDSDQHSLPGKVVVSGIGCGLWLWHSLDFSIYFLHSFVETKCLRTEVSWLRPRQCRFQLLLVWQLLCRDPRFGRQSFCRIGSYHERE